MSKKMEVSTDTKKADRKSVIIGITIMIGSFVIGMIGGFCWKMFDGFGEFFSDFATKFTAIINSESYYVGLIVSALAAILSFILYYQSRRVYAVWDEEDEEVMDKVDRNLSLAVIVPNVALIFTYIATSIGLGQLPVFFEEGEFAIAKSIILIGGMLFSLLVALVINNKVVNFEKEMNPEKKGNIFDYNFQKKWMESSDEAEKLVTYKCGYAGYKVTNSVCSLLLLVCMFGMANGQWDNTPVLMVGVIWMCSYLGYSAEALKLSKNASRIQE